MSFVATAPAKVILFGEHAVVYGIPAIAVPVDSLRARAHIKHTPQPLSLTSSDLGNTIVFGAAVHDETSRPLALLMQQVVKCLHLSDPRGEVFLESSIPISSGLGSSAAISSVVARAIAGLHDCQLSLDELNRLVFETERIYHGTPSGIDNTVVVFEKPICFVKGRKPVTLVPVGKYNFIIADSGCPASTRKAVDRVRSLYQRDKLATQEILEDIRRIVSSARSCLHSGNHQKLGSLMIQNHRLLERLCVSSPMLDSLVDAALGAGALGAKLSGGGMGGNMIALADQSQIEVVKQALLDAGAAKVRQFTLRQENTSR